MEHFLYVGDMYCAATVYSKHRKCPWRARSVPRVQSCVYQVPQWAPSTHREHAPVRSQRAECPRHARQARAESLLYAADVSKHLPLANTLSTYCIERTAECPLHINMNGMLPGYWEVFPLPPLHSPSSSFPGVSIPTTAPRATICLTHTSSHQQVPRAPPPNHC